MSENTIFEFHIIPLMRTKGTNVDLNLLGTNKATRCHMQSLEFCNLYFHSTCAKLDCETPHKCDVKSEALTVALAVNLIY